MASKSQLTISRQRNGVPHWDRCKWIIVSFSFFKKNVPGCPLTAPPDLSGSFVTPRWLYCLLQRWFYLYAKTELIWKTVIRLTKGTPTEDLWPFILSVVTAFPRRMQTMCVPYPDHYFIPLWKKVKERFEKWPSIRDAQSFLYPRQKKHRRKICP